jgi:hypothetical protein
LALSIIWREKYALVPKELPAESNDSFVLTLLEGAALRTGDSSSYREFDAKLTSLKGADNGWKRYRDGAAAERDLNFAVALENFIKCDADKDFIDPACTVSAASVEMRQGSFEKADSQITAAVQRYPRNSNVLSEAIFIKLVIGDVAAAKQLHATLAGNTVHINSDADDCLYFYGLDQPILAESHCDAMTEKK